MYIGQGHTLVTLVYNEKFIIGNIAFFNETIIIKHEIPTLEAGSVRLIKHHFPHLGTLNP